MNLPTIIGSLLVFSLFFAILGRGIFNRKRGKSGCSCGCSGCPSQGLCHPKRQ